MQCLCRTTRRSTEKAEDHHCERSLQGCEEEEEIEILKVHVLLNMKFSEITYGLFETQPWGRGFLVNTDKCSLALLIKCLLGVPK